MLDLDAAAKQGRGAWKDWRSKLPFSTWEGVVWFAMKAEASRPHSKSEKPLQKNKVPFDVYPKRCLQMLDLANIVRQALSHTDSPL